MLFIFFLILFLMFSVWLQCCWFVLGIYSLFKVFRGFKKTSLKTK
ncbi:hypothetical protein HPSJM_05035 [Helicobacter pylori SJM180]|nr:hypothetical protein HPSJM_05035 [Helicobacter pylori SJM180]